MSDSTPLSGLGTTGGLFDSDSASSLSSSGLMHLFSELLQDLEGKSGSDGADGSGGLGSGSGSRDDDFPGADSPSTSGLDSAPSGSSTPDSSSGSSLTGMMDVLLVEALMKAMQGDSGSSQTGAIGT